MELFLVWVRIVESGSMAALYATSFHFSFLTAFMILACKTRLAVTDTPLVDASDNGNAFNLAQIG